MTDKKDSFEITKRFMAQIDRDRCSHSSISRGQDENGHPVAGSTTKVLEGFDYAQAGHQDDLGLWSAF